MENSYDIQSSANVTVWLGPEVLEMSDLCNNRFVNVLKCNDDINDVTKVKLKTSKMNIPFGNDICYELQHISFSQLVMMYMCIFPLSPVYTRPC